ncbi:assimilatory sulfite reductase (NADPH) flavoprotein subunit [Dasania marina]|uniref:assimilatory sulfite reductase (NADPH) flavoprotein subunit n=1 Tax=Dasania marina TaxID=471499 RepID=UPI0030DB4573|tara:strand:- start:4703 stop:6547 length:1845 start_codon:yes stop_codon:yes gene_type:complete
MSNEKSAAQLAVAQTGPQGLLSTEQMGRVQGAITDLQPQQLIWLSGYFAGLSGQSLAVGATAPAVESAPGATITVLYGSQTGNARGVAERLHAHLSSKGAAVKLLDMEDYNPRHLKSETHLAIVVSTQGEGDPPDSARGFLEFVQGKKAPKLANLSYSVIGLGDSSYEFYCKTGKDFDERLAELGASRIGDRLDADIDYQAETEQWLDQWQGYWQDNLANAGSAAAAAAAAPALSLVTESAYNKFAPFSADIIDNFAITGSGSEKKIMHVEISLEDSGLSYQPGDALGIWHSNDAELVEEILAVTQLEGDTEITSNKQQKTLREALLSDRELTLLHPKLVEYLVENSGENDKRLVWKGLAEGERADFLAALYTRQVVEVLAEMPHGWQAQELFDQLRPLTPRLYSIASSQSAVEEEVHVTVREVVAERQGKKRFGGASHYLASLTDDDKAKVFIEPNRHFHLPESTDTPIIMVGAGTGVAPYRGFMQEREAQGAQGESWLFFGNSNARYEFLYQTQWQAWHKSGLLSRIDLAFSRDQAERIYVQDRIRQQGEDIFTWLEKGAHFYVCGDKDAMAKGVEQALIDVIAAHNDKGIEFAKAYLDDLQRKGRYQKDVY